MPVGRPPASAESLASAELPRGAGEVGADSLEELLAQALVLDLELDADGSLRLVGALRGDCTFEHVGRRQGLAALVRLEAFAEGARFLLGHNILSHDIPALRRLAPDLRLLSLPVVDSLYLSPLAFPQNPYHRLVKDYKLVKGTANEPVADARLAVQLFRDEWHALAEPAESPVRSLLLQLFRYCLAEANLGGQPGDGRGLGLALEAMGAPPCGCPEEAVTAFHIIAEGRSCPVASLAVAQELIRDPNDRPALAYAAAWLQVAGSDSVLPPWVRRRFPLVAAGLRRLREHSCGKTDCDYCRENHDPEGALRRFFGFPHYRSLPDGTSLQRQVVTRGMAGAPLLAVLPTGGGKSLCYQIPGLARYERLGVLTVVISPLQALMKDQVDNLCRRTNTTAAAAICGMLTPLERSDALSHIRLGNAALVYLSPEQLRNRSVREALRQREIGCWVFDEAHCLSKWGHDFRPDYLFAARFIRELAQQQQQTPPPVACFTATAKKEVVEEILQHFQDELGQQLEFFPGSVERHNLRFEVQSVSRGTKLQRIGELLEHRLTQGGAALVYCATRRRCEELAGALAAAPSSWRVAAFHAGLSAPEKRRIQDEFVAGQLQVVCATNAFGMGIDKEDVRLVIHADVPGSLENYLQEAGRAGRDLGEADCVLLFDEEDIETQFRLGALSQLSQRDIQQILRGLRRAQRDAQGNVVLTAGELLSDEEVDTDFDPSVPDATTRVRAAIAWLERAGFVERNENETRVFQGRPLVRSVAEAQAKMETLALPETTCARWKAILAVLLERRANEGVSTDDLAHLPQAAEPSSKGEAQERHSRQVIRALTQMADAGLIERGLRLTAYLRPNGKKNARVELARLCAVDRAFVKLLQQEGPDDDREYTHLLSLRRCNQRLMDEDPSLGSSPELLRQLLKSLSQDGRGLAGARGSVLLRHVSRDCYAVRLQRSWAELNHVAELRRSVATVALGLLCDQAALANNGGATPTGGEVLVSFALEDVARAVNDDLALASMVRDPLAVSERALMFLHEHRIITLQQGLAVFRQAMTVRVLPQARGRRYTRGDFAPLARHYDERVFQVHVMSRYAQLGLDEISQALRFVTAYFTLGRKELVRRYLPQPPQLLRRATSAESFRRIVDDLKNPAQMAVVASATTHNALILAGPGAGKTRVVVHRAAYLLRVQRQPPRSLLLLTFNHAAAVALRQRLFELVGDDARGVTVVTYHGLAMLLLGASFAARAEQEGSGSQAAQEQLDRLIPDATSLLRGERELVGLAGDDVRERLLAGYRFILVDEYQDIDEKQYELLSALVGRSQQDPERKLSLLAVGDDDQSIYGFRHANVRFIRQFQEDYQAELHSLVENYRSTQTIIDAANALIRHNRDRMKSDRPIRIDHQRRQLPPGGPLASLDGLSRGQVQILSVADGPQQAVAIADELQRLHDLVPETSWDRFAVLGRRGLQHPELADLRTLLEQRGIPVSFKIQADAAFALHRVRELHFFLSRLRERRDEYLSAAELIEWVNRELPAPLLSPWTTLLLELLQAWQNETGDGRQPVPQALEFLFAVLAERRREQRLGSGVFLGTVHGAKGLEFDHVVVGDGGWREEGNARAREEERRLYYVAMTRARQSLTLLRQDVTHNPHLRLLAPELPCVRTVPPACRWPVQLPHQGYHLLGLSQIDLDFAGRHRPGHPVHVALAGLTTGQSLQLERRAESWFLCAPDGQPVARLSRSGTDSLGQLACPGPFPARVVALLTRFSHDAREQHFRDRHRISTWEIPLAELRLPE